MRKVICERCGAAFEKEQSQIARTNHNFCSRSCANSFSGRKRKGPYKGREKEYLEARNLRKEGYGYRTIASKVGVPHHTVRGWVKDIRADSKRAYELSSKTRKSSLGPKAFEKLRTSSAIRKRLIAELGNTCMKCGVSNWLGDPITIELHHVDGNKKNGARENLQLLCPNCHSQTNNYRNRQRA